jgi:hypothetical protein
MKIIKQKINARKQKIPRWDYYFKFYLNASLKNIKETKDS